MSPVWIIEGDRTKEHPVPDPSATDRRFSDLAAAIRDHEAAVNRREVLARPQDLSLYRRLRQICGER
jgi:hypothetical protein